MISLYRVKYDASLAHLNPRTRVVSAAGRLGRRHRASTSTATATRADVNATRDVDATDATDALERARRVRAATRAGDGTAR